MRGASRRWHENSLRIPLDVTLRCIELCETRRHHDIEMAKRRDRQNKQRGGGSPRSQRSRDSDGNVLEWIKHHPGRGMRYGSEHANGASSGQVSSRSLQK